MSGQTFLFGEGHDVGSEGFEPLRSDRDHVMVLGEVADGERAGRAARGYDATMKFATGMGVRPAAI